MYDDRVRGRMAEIVNNAIASSRFGSVVGVLTKDDFSPNDSGKLIHFATFTKAPDPLEAIFAKCAADRRFECRSFYHFKSVKRAIDILKTGKVQLTALYYHAQNDSEEYSEFFNRTGHTYPLETGKIDELKKKSFVLCLTKSAGPQKFWSQYAHEDTGVCLAMRYNTGKMDFQDCVDFRDVTYGTGYPFDFIREIRDRFISEFGKAPFIDGILKFARFYKRAKFSWEDESRISFDYTTHPWLCEVFPIQTEMQNGKVTRKYIKVPLTSDHFTLQVDEIICGKHVTGSDQNRLLSASNLRADRIWVRK